MKGCKHEWVFLEKMKRAFWYEYPLVYVFYCRKCGEIKKEYEKK